MKGRRIKLKNGSEYDVLSRVWKKALSYLKRPGVSAKVKRRIRRRERRELKKRLMDGEE